MILSAMVPTDSKGIAMVKATLLFDELVGSDPEYVMCFCLSVVKSYLWVQGILF
jgi:hypothetical protein